MAGDERKRRGGRRPGPMEGDAKEPLLGAPPRIDEPERPAIGAYVSLAWPGAVGEHQNPVAGVPEDARVAFVETHPPPPDDRGCGDCGGSRVRAVPSAEVARAREAPGAVPPPPAPAPNVTPTGAVDGPHPPAPPYEHGERRLAQQDWERWRAEDRRRVPYGYPAWRT